MKFGFRWVGICVCLGVFAVACGGGNSGEEAVVIVEEDGDAVLVSRVVVEPGELSVAVHESRVLRGEAQDDGGAVVDVKLEWTSEDEGVAVVDGDGLVVGVGAGKTTIVVTAGKQSARAVVTVRALEYRSVAVAAEHSCAVTWSGGVYCWGSNNNDQLGHKEVGVFSVPAKVRLPELMASVTVAKRHSCALSEGGQAYCWGRNSHLQVGVAGTGQELVAPTALIGPRYKALSAADYHTCGLTVDDEVYCWGDNTSGGLGMPGLSSSPTPRKVVFDAKVKQVVASQHNTCVLDMEGKAYCFGYNGGMTLLPFEGENSFVPLRVGGDVLFTNLALNTYSVCGVTTQGPTLCWGLDVFFSRGLAQVDTYLPLPIASMERFVTLSGTNYSFCGLNHEGQLHCWGYNRFGGLGDGTRKERLPGPVAGTKRWSSVAIGEEHSCGIEVDGTLWCWGNNPFGQVGDGRTVVHSEPVRAAGESIRLDNIMSSHAATCGHEKNSKRIFCWGGSSHGQLGNLRLGEHAEKPTLAQYPDKQWQHLSMAHTHSCALTALGKAYCWGSNQTWQLGNGFTGTANWSLSEVVGNLQFASIYAGDNHTCALTRTGQAYCWGMNHDGQLGSRGADGSPTPVAVSTNLRFAQLAIGNSHTCGLTDDGAVYCWGANNYGVLGSDSAPASSALPILVVLEEPVVSLKSGSIHTCGLSASGVLRCWGWNELGSLGEGSYLPVSGPAVVMKGPWVDFNIGGWTSCARNAEDELYCWGWNVHSQITSQPFWALTAPVLINLDFPARKFSVGGGFVCVLDESGHPYCWGLNSVGELGNEADYYHLGATRVVAPGVGGGGPKTTITSPNVWEWPN